MEELVVRIESERSSQSNRLNMNMNLGIYVNDQRPRDKSKTSETVRRRIIIEESDGFSQHLMWHMTMSAWLMQIHEVDSDDVSMQMQHPCTSLSILVGYRMTPHQDDVRSFKEYEQK